MCTKYKTFILTKWCYESTSEVDNKNVIFFSLFIKIGRFGLYYCLYFNCGEGFYVINKKNSVNNFENNLIGKTANSSVLLIVNSIICWQFKNFCLQIAYELYWKNCTNKKLKNKDTLRTSCIAHDIIVCL